MAVVKITDNKINLPAIVKVSIGRSSILYPVKLSSVIYNKPVI